MFKTKDEIRKHVSDKVKRKIKQDLIHISQFGKDKNQKNSPIRKIFDEGFVIGSLFGNLYLEGSNRPESDIDIVVNYNPGKHLEFMKWVKETFSDVNITGRSEIVEKEYEDRKIVFSLKFVVGSIKKYKINVLFVEDMKSIMNFVETFDLENSNWFYSLKNDELYASEKCINLINKKEVEYTERNIKKIMDGAENIHIAPIEKRLRNYIKVKGYVMTAKMRKCVEILVEEHGLSREFLDG